MVPASGGHNGEGGLGRHVLGSVTLDFKRLGAPNRELVDLIPREFGLLRFSSNHPAGAGINRG